jgi:hypothetical protein
MTKKEKIEAYTYAMLVIMIDHVDPFICVRLNEWLHYCYGLVSAWDIKDVSKYFPEIMQLQPDQNDKSGGWWPTTKAGNELRLIALEKAIQLVQNKNNFIT